MVSINISLVFTIINLIIFYLLMKKFLIGPINGIMEKRKTLIAQQLDQAKKTQEQAEACKTEYEKSLEGARTESNQIMEAAKARAQKEYDSIVAQANEKSAKLIADSEKTIEQDRKKALDDMQSQIAQLALAAVGKVIPEEISQEENDRYYAHFLKEAGDVSETGSH